MAYNRKVKFEPGYNGVCNIRFDNVWIIGQIKKLDKYTYTLSCVNDKLVNDYNKSISELSIFKLVTNKGILFDSLQQAKSAAILALNGFDITQKVMRP